MRRIIVIDLVIIILTLVIVLPLAFTAQSSYAGYNVIDVSNASRALTFDLQRGQTVTGSFSFSGNERAGYIIYNQNIGEVIVSQTSEHRGDFTFTAKTDGQYYLNIQVENPFGEYLDYSYSISAPPILGVDRIVLIGLVITIGVVLALIVAVLSLSRKRNLKNPDKELSDRITNAPISYVPPYSGFGMLVPHFWHL
jgi:ABC-type cobalt transport system substrate-binding protein